MGESTLSKSKWGHGGEADRGLHLGALSSQQLTCKHAWRGEPPPPHLPLCQSLSAALLAAVLPVVLTALLTASPSTLSCLVQAPGLSAPSVTAWIVSAVFRF